MATYYPGSAVRPWRDPAIAARSTTLPGACRRAHSRSVRRRRSVGPWALTALALGAVLALGAALASPALAAAGDPPAVEVPATGDAPATSEVPAAGEAPAPGEASATGEVPSAGEAPAAAAPAADPVTLAGASAPIEIRRVGSAITIDGDLSDPGWAEAARVETWFETNPGDNLPPKQRNVAWLGYDDRYLYAAFEFEDPEPARIRAPLADRDEVPSTTDYGGVIVDATNDGKTAQMFLANPRGIQYDAITSDAAGEDSAPDFYWDSAGRITARGWTLELRIPFSSLRYQSNGGGPQQWGIMLYRNRPREFRYQHFTSRLPRDVNCFICNVRPLVGLDELPGGGHWVIAPYGTASRLSTPRGGLGTPLEDDDPEGDGGLDVKWLPTPGRVVDGTLNPDFSQVESDVAQIAANERFALFFPERRPFFLEGIDLFSTPIQAVYTRSFTQPRWGLRATGELGASSYVLLVGEDEGGGSVILPGANSSDLAAQDFASHVAIGRWRRDFGQSFVSVLYSGREIEGGAYNRLLGPDFRWRPTARDTISAQILFSESEAPVRPDLAEEWDGRTLSGHAAELWWSRGGEAWDVFVEIDDLGEGFRADNGFVPEVGLTAGYGELGRSFYPEGKAVSRLRLFTFSQYAEDQSGALLRRGITPGFGFDAKLNSFVRFEFAFEDIRGIERVHRRFQVRPRIYLRPSRRLAEVYLEAEIGDEIDFANDRLGEGVTLRTGADLRPTDHLRFGLIANRRWLDVTADGGRSGRLFTADVARLRAVYTFNARSWLRLIGQWVETERDPALYTFAVDDRSASFAGSAVFAFKLNWQSVLYLGWSDGRELDDRDHLRPAEEQLFLKLSYAFQG